MSSIHFETLNILASYTDADDSSSFFHTRANPDAFSVSDASSSLSATSETPSDSSMESPRPIHETGFFAPAPGVGTLDFLSQPETAGFGVQDGPYKYEDEAKYDAQPSAKASRIAVTPSIGSGVRVLPVVASVAFGASLFKSWRRSGRKVSAPRRVAKLRTGQAVFVAKIVRPGHYEQQQQQAALDAAAAATARPSFPVREAPQSPSGSVSSNSTARPMRSRSNSLSSDASTKSTPQMTPTMTPACSWVAAATVPSMPAPRQKLDVLGKRSLSLRIATPSCAGAPAAATSKAKRARVACASPSSLASTEELRALLKREMCLVRRGDSVCDRDGREISRSFVIVDDESRIVAVRVAATPRCSCAGFASRGLCAHTAFVFCRVLKADASRRDCPALKATLTREELTLLFAAAPSDPRLDVLRQDRVRRTFGSARAAFARQNTQDRECSLCCRPLIARNAAGAEQPLTYCVAKCGLNFHKSCMATWEGYHARSTTAVPCKVIKAAPEGAPAPRRVIATATAAKALGVATADLAKRAPVRARPVCEQQLSCPVCTTAWKDRDDHLDHDAHCQMRSPSPYLMDISF